MAVFEDTRVLRALSVTLILWLVFQVSWGKAETKHEADCNQARLRCSLTQDKVPQPSGLDDLQALAEAKQAYKAYDDMGCEEVAS